VTYSPLDEQLLMGRPGPLQCRIDVLTDQLYQRSSVIRNANSDLSQNVALLANRLGADDDLLGSRNDIIQLPLQLSRFCLLVRLGCNDDSTADPDHI